MKQILQLFKKQNKIQRALEIINECANEGDPKAKKMLKLYEVAIEQKTYSPLEEKINLLRRNTNFTHIYKNLFKTKKTSQSKKITNSKKKKK